MPIKFSIVGDFAGFKKRLLLTVVLINLIMYLLVLVSLYQSRVKYDEQASVSTQNLATTLDSRIKGEIDSIDLALIAVKHEAESEISRVGIDKETLNRYMVQLHSHLPELQGLRMTDSKGEAVYG